MKIIQPFIIYSLLINYTPQVQAADAAATSNSAAPTKSVEELTTLLNNNSSEKIDAALENYVNKTISTEGKLNDKLLENSKTADEYQKATNAKKLNNKVRTYGASQDVEGLGLTDQEKELSENYVHQGMANSIIKEKCVGDLESACDGEAGKTKFMGVDSQMISLAARMYATFGAISGGLKLEKKAEAKKANSETKSTTESNSTENADTKDSKTKEEATDYCKYIPAGTEGVATIQQMAENNNIKTMVEASADTAQANSLLAAAKSHDARAKMAQIQAAGWFGGAACYVVLSTTNFAGTGVAVNKNLIIKLGAATFLGMFYQNEVKANKEYASKIRAIASSLPKKGDCNPITDRLCYCSQESTKNDPTYCLATTNSNAKVAADSYKVACTTNELKVDAQCNCIKTNTCMESFLDSATDGALSLGMNNSSSPFNGIRSLARGELLGGSSLNDSSYGKLAAIAKDGLKKAAIEMDDLDLNKKQINDSKLLESKGIPSGAARALASYSPSDAELNAAMGKLGGSTGPAMAAIGPDSKSNLLQFSGGSGLGVGGKKEKSNNNESDDLFKKLTGNKKANPNDQTSVIRFAQLAEENARKSGQIRKADTPLFEIISMKYQTTGRRLLEIKEE